MDATSSNSRRRRRRRNDYLFGWLLLLGLVVVGSWGKEYVSNRRVPSLFRRIRLHFLFLSFFILRLALATAIAFNYQEVLPSLFYPFTLGPVSKLHCGADKDVLARVSSILWPLLQLLPTVSSPFFSIMSLRQISAQSNVSRAVFQPSTVVIKEGAAEDGRLEPNIDFCYFKCVCFFQIVDDDIVISYRGSYQLNWPTFNEEEQLSVLIPLGLENQWNVNPVDCRACQRIWNWKREEKLLKLMRSWHATSLKKR